MSINDRLSGTSGDVAVKTPCIVATIANITLSGTQTIDGIAVIAGDRVLVKSQTASADNGIWVVYSTTWQRSKDFDGARDIVKGTAVYVFAGDTQDAGTWRLTTDDPVIGTTSLTFELDTVTSVDGNVTGAASSTNSNFALFSGTTGKVLKDSSINISTFDLAGAADDAISDHVAESDPHTQYLERANNLTDVVSASAARSALGLGTAATTAASAYATAAQGAKADTALQAADIGTTVKIDTTMFATNVIDTDTSLTANSDTRIATQKAVKAYVSSVSSGSTPRTACRVSTTIALTATYSNGSSGVGATLTNSSTQVAITIDGTALSLNDRVLVQSQVSTFQNGIYTVTTVGSGASNWVLTRATDFDSDSAVEIALNALVTLSEGTTLAGNTYYLSGAGPYTVGTTAIIFSLFSSASNIAAGDGLGKTGNTISVDSTVARQTITTKGDLLSRTSLIDARLAVGSNGRLLTADSSTSTGLSWKDAWVLDAKTVFGAVGDGVADDTAALQAGLDYIETYGGTLNLGDGSYRITSALSKTFDFTAVTAINRPSVLGNNWGNCQILWDGANSPSTFALTLQRGDTADQGSHAHCRVGGFSILPINSGKNQYASGLKLVGWAYIEGDAWVHRMNYGVFLDRIISSRFKFNTRFNNYNIWSIGYPTSTATSAYPYPNNANFFDHCIVGAGLLGGFTSIDGGFTFNGGTIEVNGFSGSTGSGYGVKIDNTGITQSILCNFNSTYFEGNGTTGDLGSNASTADVIINHSNVSDNHSYNFQGCLFNRISTNYAPYCIYINKTSSSACHLSVNACHFTNYSGYSASATRPYIKFVDGGGGLTNVNLDVTGNFYQQAIEQPDFILGAVYRPGTIASFVRVKSYSALVYKNTAQSIPNASATALNFDAADYNDAGMWSSGSPTRLTVLAGVTRVRLAAGVRYVADGTTNVNWQLFIRKNGSSFNGMPYQQLLNPSGSTASHTLNISSGILNVSGGDYFESYTQQNSGASVNTDTVLSGTTWFSMEIVE